MPTVQLSCILRTRGEGRRGRGGLAPRQACSVSLLRAPRAGLVGTGGLSPLRPGVGIEGLRTHVGGEHGAGLFV